MSRAARAAGSAKRSHLAGGAAGAAGQLGHVQPLGQVCLELRQDGRGPLDHLRGTPARRATCMP